MGDQNAPERIKVVIGESGRPVAIHRGLPLLYGSALGEVVDAAAYDRVVAERDEARAQYHHAERNELRYREALAQADDLVSVKGYTAARVVIGAAWAEGEQPAGSWGFCDRCGGKLGDTPHGTLSCRGCDAIDELARLRSAAGVQSTTETGAEPETVVVRSGDIGRVLARLVALSNVANTSAADAESLGPFERLRDAIGGATAVPAFEAAQRLAASPSTTETATGHPRKACPDGGTCHHWCDETCFRAETCEPLSSFGDTWPSTRPVDLPAAPATPEGTDAG